MVSQPKGRERLVPDVDQMIAAQKAILDRLVPSLKAVEATGADGSPLSSALTVVIEKDVAAGC